VCHIVAKLPFTLKSIVKASEELWKIKYFIMQKYNFLNIHYFFTIFFENFNIFENSIVSVELAKVLGYTL
jgi:hypothetical protein